MQDNLLSSDQVIRELIKERRSEKRWKNIRFFIGLMIVIAVIVSLFASAHSTVDLTGADSKDYVSYIKLDGMIGPGRDFSAETVVPLLKDAFADKEAKGVVLDIDSGGGTPVQAAIIHDAILTLKRKYNKKVVVVGEDILASGAYFVAVSADKIYVNPNTVTGSIGVIMKSFGFPDLIKKIGVERRVYTSGENKDRLDAFLPQNKEDIAKIHQVISEVHTNFDQAVLLGRKGKLQGDTKDLFSGDFWTGQTALKLGLVDGLGNLMDVLQNEFHVSRYKDYSVTLSPFKSLTNQLGMSLDMALNGDQSRVLM